MNYRIGSLLLVFACALPAQDVREKFEANGFFGVSVDSFAAAEVNKYINPDQSGKIKERAVGGIAFNFRLIGDNEPEGNSWIKRSKLFVFGETVHGARSAGVDCTADEAATGDKTAAICVQFDPTKPNRTLALIRNSTSLEAFAGFRWEFLKMRESTLYAKAQAGFLSVAGVGGDVLDSHHVGLGILSTAGDFHHSYLEAGVGRSDVFPTHRSPRLKIDGYLEFPLLKGETAKWLRGFARMTVDSNPRPGASDSIQSYFGIKFDLKGLF